MSKTSKEADFSSIITQVAREGDNNRPIPLTNTAGIPGTSPTANGTRSKRAERFSHLFFNFNRLFSSFRSQTSLSLRFTLLPPCFQSQSSEESDLFATARCRCQSWSKCHPIGTAKTTNVSLIDSSYSWLHSIQSWTFISRYPWSSHRSFLFLTPQRNHDHCS